jgi:antitoxin component of MazEF toxin-antitoxin module
MSNTKTSFQNKIIKQGNGFGVRIPMYYIRAGVIDPAKKYTVTLQEAEVSA